MKYYINLYISHAARYFNWRSSSINGCQSLIHRVSSILIVHLIHSIQHMLLTITPRDRFFTVGVHLSDLENCSLSTSTFKLTFFSKFLILYDRRWIEIIKKVSHNYDDFFLLKISMVTLSSLWHVTESFLYLFCLISVFGN